MATDLPERYSEVLGIWSLRPTALGVLGLGNDASTILGPANISFGFNGTKTTTLTEFSYADLNGDGLPDMISRDGDK